MADTIMTRAKSGAGSGEKNITAYLDTAAELSKIDQFGHHQATADGYPLVYDMLITITTVPSEAHGVGLLNGEIKTVPENWTVRNACRMAYHLREEQREEAGVSKESIGRYAKNIRYNMDSSSYNIAYDPDSPTYASTQRLYALSDVSGEDAFAGGTWDFTQLAQFTEDPLTGVTTGDPFYLNILGGHSAAAPGPYTYIGVLQAYHQRRQTVRDDSTLTPGGDTQFIVNDSPFFRVPIQDVGEDSYVEVTLDEQDEPPYSRAINLATTDRLIAQPQEFFNLTAQRSMVTCRIQAPLGLVKFELNCGYTDQDVDIKIEVLGTYEMK